MKIKDILLNGIKILKDNNIEDANMKCKIVLADLLGKNKEYLVSHDEDEIEDGLNRIFLEKIERLKNHEPLQYIINKQEFGQRHFDRTGHIFVLKGFRLRAVFAVFRTSLSKD